MTTNGSFNPMPGLSSPHLQTLWSTLFRKPPTLERRRETLPLPDGDFIHLDWYGTNETSPLIILLHGLTGSSDSSYITGLQKQLHNKNWQSVAVNFRGCSGEYNHLPRSYHSGDSQELNTILEILTCRYPGRTFAAVGYSLGGNVLLKYQGEQAGESKLECAVAVSVPFRLDLCAERMNQGFSRLYRNRFLKDLSGQIEDKRQFFTQKQWHDHADYLDQFIRLDPIKTFQQFDHEITAPMHGFLSGTDYYEKSSSRYYLKEIKKPTLILHARDDPFMTPKTIPSLSELSQDTCLELSEKGGHVGFIGGTLYKPEYWLEQKIPDFLASYLG